MTLGFSAPSVHSIIASHGRLAGDKPPPHGSKMLGLRAVDGAGAGCACAVRSGAPAISAEAAASVVPPSRMLRRLSVRSCALVSPLVSSRSLVMIFYLP